MNRFGGLLLLSLTATLSHAQPSGAAAPICPDKTAPDCVLSNWGQVDPDGLTDLVSRPGTGPGDDGDTRRSARPGVQIAVGTADTSAKSGHAPGSSIKTVISPPNLFPNETRALIAAVKRARFNPDGSFASGEAAVASAAAAATRRAGERYVLTLYVQVPRAISPDDGAQLNKKVRSINDVLQGASQASAKPK